jgi:N-acetylglucosaminyl-diphospho-decaprenol L-rhamnosyltransferase
VSNTRSTPDVSVVIVSWNTKDLLLRCIESVLKEQAKSGLLIETIVVDNASSDGSADAVRLAAPDVLVLPQRENCGFAAATNIGITTSQGATVLALNPDAELQPDSLRTMWTVLHASPHIGMVAPVLLNSDGSFQSAGYRFPGMTQTILDLFPLHPRLVESSLNGRYSRGDGRTPFQIDHPLGACMLVRRSVIEDVGSLDEGYFLYSEEIDWCRRIRNAGWTILCAPAASVIHAGGQSAARTPDRMRTQLHQSRARYLRRYHSPAFHRTLDVLIRVGISIKRAGVPIPTDGRTADDLAGIAQIYRGAGGEDQRV